MPWLSGLSLDREFRQLRWRDRKVELRPRPFRILETLMHARDHRATQRELGIALYGVPPKAIATIVSLARAALHAVDAPVTLATLGRAAYFLALS